MSYSPRGGKESDTLLGDRAIASIATIYLTRGGAQAVMGAMGSGCKR